jgi:hypothetical protein
LFNELSPLDGSNHSPQNRTCQDISRPKSKFLKINGLEPNENGTEIIARALQQNLNTPEFRQIADSDKQKFYKLMVGLATYLGVAYQQAVTSNDSRWIGQLKDAASASLKGFLKLDPTTVLITANGLEIKPR